MTSLHRRQLLRLPILLALSTLATITTRAQDNIDPNTVGACVNATDPCVPTYHNDNARDGIQPNETVLNSSLFGTTVNFGFIGSNATKTSTVIDGLIYAQPLYLTGIKMATSTCSGTMNIVIVASENNGVYVFQVDNSSPGSFKMITCWTKSFNKTNSFGSESSIPFTALPLTGGSPPQPCNNVVPESGITSTPVIDTKSTPPVMYFVTGHQVPGSGGSFTYTYRLHVVMLNSGNESQAGPYDVADAIADVNPKFPFKANQQNQRVGLAMYRSGSKANIYIGFGSFCDSNLTSQDQYSGYMVGIQFAYGSSTPFSTIGVFTSEGAPFTGTNNTGSDGGIWMGGGAPVLDANHNLYIAVGNGDFNASTSSTLPTNFGESMVKLVQTSTPSLTAVDFYTPNDWSILNSNPSSNPVCIVNNTTSSCPLGKSISTLSGDFDLGSGGVTLISPLGITSPLCPSNQELIAGGKEGVLYGTCYSTSTSSSPQSTMGGLDGCGYKCNNTSTAAVTACTQNTQLPTAGNIAQCFPGVTIPNPVVGAPGSRATGAFWGGNSTKNIVENWLYIAGSGDSLRGYVIDTSTSLFKTAAFTGTKPKTYSYPGASPSLSWDNNSANNALLWAVDPIQPGAWNGQTNQTTKASDAQLDVYSITPNAQNQLPELWSSGSGSGPGAVKYAVPTVANGMVFVAGGAANYAPGPQGGQNGAVNCYPAASGGSTPTCTGLLAVYGKLTP